jgi:transcription initiation factor IIE alpha subunit
MRKKGKLTDDQVRAIRAVAVARSRTPSDDELAKTYGISKRTVRGIMARELYKSVPDNPPDSTS